MERIAVIGAGGLAREVAWLIERINEVKPTWEMIGFIDKNTALGSVLADYPVMDEDEFLARADTGINIVCGIGSPKIRKRAVEAYSAAGFEFPSLIDPSATVAKSAIIGRGAVVNAGCVVGVDAKVGEFAYLYYNSTVNHDDVIGKYAVVCSNASVSGNVSIDECAFVGAGASIKQGVNIEAGAVIGAGAVVVRDIPANVTAVGCPARVIKNNEQC